MNKSTQQFVIYQIQPFIEQIPLEQINFPIFNITYSLWRSTTYKKLQNLIKPSQYELKIVSKQFFQASQRKILPKFITKLKKQLDGRQIGWRKVIQQQNSIKNANKQENSEIIFHYSETIFMQELYVQLFKDLVSAPYLSLYSQKPTFEVNQRFLNSCYKKKNQKFIDKTFNKIGKTALSKGLNMFSQSIISKSFLYKMSSLVGSFNPLLMIASLSIGTLIENYDQKNKIQKMIDQIKVLTEQIQKNIKFLQEHYQKCLSLIEVYLISYETDLKKIIKKQIGKVLSEDWLLIEQQQNGQWQVVTLKQKQSFQLLENQNSQKIVLEDLEK